jgi:tRNA-binding protein
MYRIDIGDQVFNEALASQNPSKRLAELVLQRVLQKAKTRIAYQKNTRKMSTISWEDFNKVELRIGTVVEIRRFPQARKPAYQLWVDLGPLGIKKSSAQITQNYQPEQLVGKQVLCVCNFPPRQIGPFLSEILVTGFTDQQGSIVLATADGSIANGQKLH